MNVTQKTFAECHLYQASAYFKNIAGLGSFAGDWKPVGPLRYALAADGMIGGLGRISALAFAPDEPETIYAGSAAGPLWRLRRGVAWEPLGDSWGVSGIAIDPDSPDTIYVLTGDGDGYTAPGYSPMSIGVAKSTDGGLTWKPTGTLTTSAFVGYKLAMSPADSSVLFAATNQGLFRTEDGGESWTKVVSGYFYDLEFKPDEPSVVYAATQYLIYRSLDGGRQGSWKEMKALPDPASDDTASFRSASRIELAVTPAEGFADVVYALYGGNYGQAGFYRSEDAGETFNLRSNAPNFMGLDRLGNSDSAVCWYYMALAASPIDGDKVFAGGANIWQSDDGGVNWRIVTYWNQREPGFMHRYVHADVHELMFQGSQLYTATDGGVFMKMDYLDSWVDLSPGLQLTQIYRICGDPNDASALYFGSQDNGSSKLVGRAAAQITSGDGTVCLVDPRDPDRIYFSWAPGSLVRSFDGGDTIQSIIPPGATDAPWVTPFVMHPDEPQTLFACYQHLWETRDGGTTWSRISTARDFGGDGAHTSSNDCIQVGVTSAGSGEASYVYVARESGVYRARHTSSGVGEWENVTGDLCDAETCVQISDLAVRRHDPHEVWVTFSNYYGDRKVFRSEPSEGGLAWRNVTGHLPNVPVNTVLLDEQEGDAYIGMDCGIYRREKGADDWDPFTHKLPDLEIEDLLIQYDRRREFRVLRAASFSWGIWESPLERVGPPGPPVKPPRPPRPPVRH